MKNPRSCDPGVCVVNYYLFLPNYTDPSLSLVSITRAYPSVKPNHVGWPDGMVFACLDMSDSSEVIMCSMLLVYLYLVNQWYLYLRPKLSQLAIKQ